MAAALMLDHVFLYFRKINNNNMYKHQTIQRESTMCFVPPVQEYTRSK